MTDDGWAPYARPRRPLPPRLVLLVLTGVVLAVVGVLAGVRALAGVAEDGATREPSPAGSDPSSAAESPAAESPAAESPTSSGATAPPEPAAVTCWDGAPAAALPACSRPEGVEGLEHVFPSLEGQECRAPVRGGEPGRVLLLRCTASLEDGSKVLVSYAQWDTVADATAHFDGKGLDRADSPEVLGWSGESDGPDPLWNAAFVYRDEPFSASWFAATTEEVALALDTGLVEGRPADEVRGVPTP